MKSPYMKYDWAPGLVSRLEAAVKKCLANTPACHDWEHTLRVRKNALDIAAAENCDLLVTEAAALLHDVGRVRELADKGATDHAVLGAEMAETILGELGVDSPDFRAQVCACVRTHRFRRREPGLIPASIEAKIVFDADKLDSMGAIGLARSFHFAGRTGAKVHNSREAALSSESYSAEDTAYREFLVKLQFLKDGMLTAGGRRLAAARHDFMVEFFRQLNGETGLNG